MYIYLSFVDEEKFSDTTFGCTATYIVKIIIMFALVLYLPPHFR